MMKKLVFVFLAVSMMVSGCSQNSDWKDLFNGKNLKGWEQVDGVAEYKVVDGVIVGTSETGIPNSFLATKNIYGDFILEYEMKMDRGLNSGVQFRSAKELPNGTKRVNGYQVECDDHADRAWVGGIYEESDRGWMYPMSYDRNKQEGFIRGDWNTFRVEAVGNMIRTYVNGDVYANLVDDKRPEGIIALQVHAIGDNEALAGKTVMWRNIRIMENPQTEALTSPVDLGPEVSYLDNELTENEKAEGWKLLWDGETTEGWRGADLETFPEKGWSIKDGILAADQGDGGEATNGGDIVTIKKYSNFILELDFRIPKGANSGIKYFVNTDLNKGEGSAIGCEYQILDDKNHPDAKMGFANNRTLGSLYDLIPANALLYGQDNRTKRFNGVDKWNRARIVVQDNMVMHYLNGVKIVEYERGNDQWRELVAGSKYKDWPAFGEAEFGHILLQDHGDAVSFKNVKILDFSE